MAPPKKPNPDDPKPNNMLPVVAGVLILLGAFWTVYEFNPGFMMRAERPEEKKAREEYERNVKQEHAAHDREQKKKEAMEKRAAEYRAKLKK